jgi:hypothetical protein
MITSQKKVRVIKMIITLKTILELTNIKHMNEVTSKHSKELQAIKKRYDQQYKKRNELKLVNNVRYTSQDAIQARVINNVFIIENVKTCFQNSDRLVDKIELEKKEVESLINYFKNASFDVFKNTLRNVSKFVLFTSSDKIMCKHERFYSQCLEQFDYVLNKFYIECERSRSKNIVIKEKTLSKRETMYKHILEQLHIVSQNKKQVESKKQKTKKLVNVKKQKTKKVIA